MLKIIDGFRYDTDRAISVGSAEAKCPPNAMHWWAETLYKTPRAGKYFIAAKWNVLGKVKESVKPITAEIAAAWCELYLEGDDWKKYFPEE